MDAFASFRSAEATLIKGMLEEVPALRLMLFLASSRTP
jgi:hypothetical protein